MRADVIATMIPLCPLIGALIAWVIGKNRAGSFTKFFPGIIATLAAFISFGGALLVASTRGSIVLESELLYWLTIGTSSLSISLRIDDLAVIMMLLVTGVGSLIHLYSIGYMSHDKAQARYFTYLNLFLFSMLLLVLGANLLTVFIGWEGVGLCSYLLIGFWYKERSFSAAANKAFIVNRIGDIGFILALLFLIFHFGTDDFVQLSKKFGASPDLFVASTATFLLFFAATGKSAQIPLFVWLPDAMAGPTPVSALIHAATMVTAGVYLLVRMNWMVSLAIDIQALIAVISILSALFGAVVALVQTDLKRVLAYSTMSQLAFMFLAVSIGAYGLAIFHLVTHGFFKACLFLSAGSVIHGTDHEQDMRKLGGLRHDMPITFGCFLISGLALAGIFPFAGYQSKHLIIEALHHTELPYVGNFSMFLYWGAEVAAALTSIYVGRTLSMTFFGSYKGKGRAHESPKIMLLSMVILAALSAAGGAMLKDIILSPLPSAFDGVHMNETPLDGFVASIMPLIGLIIGFLGIKLEWRSFSYIRETLFKGFYIDALYSNFIVRPLKFIAIGFASFFDRWIIDGGLWASTAIAEVSGEGGRLIQTGQVRHYALFMLMGALCLVIFFMVL